MGADDYLTKPIKMKLLVSRVQAILKRIDADRPPEKAPAPGLTVDRERYTVIRDGQEITLPRKEFALLDLLHSSPGKLIPREEIYAKIWGTEVVVGDRTKMCIRDRRTACPDRCPGTGCCSRGRSARPRSSPRCRGCRSPEPPECRTSCPAARLRSRG